MTFARVLFCAVLLSVPAISCTVGELDPVDPDDPGADAGSQELTASEVFTTQVLPALAAKCQACHGDPAPMNGLGFMTATPTELDQLVNWPGMITASSPADSGLIAFTNDELHSGPAWDSAETDMVLDWIELYLSEN